MSLGDRIRVLSTTVVSPTEIDCRIKIKMRADLGPRDVVVTNPDGGTGIGRGVFEVE